MTGAATPRPAKAAETSHSLIPHADANTVTVTANAGPISSAPESISAISESSSDSWQLAWRATIGTWFVAWIEAFRWGRDALVRLPSLPLELWIGGIALLVVGQSLRIAAFCGRMKRAVAAPPAVLKAVGDVAMALKLKAIPRTLLIDERLSPLIWCGRKPTLILPMGLWTQLDKNGRRAILAHELAHLQRLDHWVCWLEQAVTLLYWWHPLVWWIRRRIHEEADLSCDAWVTWLMPQGRRAYAEALLRTKQFVSANGADVPAGGMAAASGKAREFARRLTMVMTYSARPRRSMTGVLLAGTLAAAGWIATPAWSCPPADAEKSSHYSALTPAGSHAEKDANRTIIVGGAPTAAAASDGVEAQAPIIWRAGVAAAPSNPLGGPAKATNGPGQAFVIGGDGHWDFVPSPDPLSVNVASPMLFSTSGGMLGGAFTLAQSVNGNGDEDQERLARLEAELHRLAAQIDEMRHGQSGGGHGHATAGPTPPAPPAPPAPPLLPQPSAPRSSAPRAAMRAPVAIPAGGEEVVRSYELPGGKIEALFALMVRDDVPIRVSRDGNRINVHGTEAQQQVFRQFIELINPGSERRTPAPSNSGGRGFGGGANRAPQGFMQPAQPSAPRGSGSRRTMRAPDNDAAKKQLAEELLRLKDVDGNPQDVARKILAKAELWQAAAQAGSKEAREKIAKVSEKLRSLSELRQVELERYARQAAQLGEQASTFGDKAQQFLQQAAELAAEKSEAGMHERAATLEKAAKDLEAKARELEKEAAKWEAKADQAEQEVDRANDQADELNGMIESVDESSSDTDEEIEDGDSPRPDGEGVTCATPAGAAAAPVACPTEATSAAKSTCGAVTAPAPVANGKPAAEKASAPPPAPASKTFR